METYAEFLNETESSLGRTLSQEELEFLSWLYSRHMEERKNNDTLETTGQKH